MDAITTEDLNFLDAENLCVTSDICAVVLGHGGEFMLVRLDKPGPIPVETKVHAMDKGYSYCGVLGFTMADQKAWACHAHTNPEALHVMSLAVPAFARQVADVIGQRMAN